MLKGVQGTSTAPPSPAHSSPVGEPTLRALLQRILRNNSWLAGSELVLRLGQAGIAIAIGHRLGQAPYGYFSVALAYNGLFSPLFDGGLSIILTREVARNRGQLARILGTLSGLKLIQVLLALALLLAGIPLLRQAPLVGQLILILGGAQCLFWLSDLIRSSFRAYEQMEYEALVKCTQGLALLGLGLFTLWQHSTLLVVVTSYLLAGTASTVLAALLVWRRLAVPRLHFDRRILPALLRQSFPLWARSLFIYFWFDTLMLSFWRGPREIGLYNSAYTLFLGTLSWPYLLSLATLPILSTALDNARRFIRIALVATAISLAGGLSAALLLSFEAGPVLSLLYGPDFSAAATPLRLLIWSLVLLCLNLPIFIMLTALNRVWGQVPTMAATMLFNIMSNYLLMPRYGMYGAAAVATGTELVQLLLLLPQLWWAIRQHFAAPPVKTLDGAGVLPAEAQ